MKRINTVKLAAMSETKIRAVCIRHADRALTYQENGNEWMCRLHASLLDQCADVLRQKLGRGQGRYQAKDLICAMHPGTTAQ